VLQLVVLELDQGVQGGRLALPAFAFSVEREVLAGYLVRIYVVLFAEFLNKKKLLNRLFCYAISQTFPGADLVKTGFSLYRPIALNSLPPCEAFFKDYAVCGNFRLETKRNTMPSTTKIVAKSNVKDHMNNIVLVE
jgi:hypothetical protein